MKLVPLERTGLTLLDVAELSKKGPVILTRKGKPLAAVKDLSGSDQESIAPANNLHSRALIAQSRPHPAAPALPDETTAPTPPPRTETPDTPSSPTAPVTPLLWAAQTRPHANV